MTDNSMRPPPGGTASPPTASTRQGRALLAAVLVTAGSVLTGVAAGLVWAAVAPRVQYQVYTLNPPTAYATNPETSAFIAADGWYCVIALAGGALIGLLAYLFAIRRYGALPMAALVVGSVAAAFIAEWLGHRQSGGPDFDHVLATSKPGHFLYAPVSLGSHGALVFWPLAAAAVAGGFELAHVLRARRQAPAPGVPMPGMDSFGARPGQPLRPDPGQPAGSWPPGAAAAGQQEARNSADCAADWQSAQPGLPAAPGRTGPDGPPVPDQRGGDQGQAQR